MKVAVVESSQPNSSRSSNLNSSPTKMNSNSVDLRQHIDEAITAVIASSTNVSNNSPPTIKNQQITSMSLGNPRVPNFADLPENLLETSTTPPMQMATSSTAASSSGAMNYALYTSQQSSGDTPVLTSLTPVHVDLAGLLPLDNSRNSYALSNIAGTSGLSSDSAGFTQLFPMVPNINVSGSSLVSGGTLPGYLAVKVEPQEVVIGGTVVSSGTVSALMSPSQLNLGGTNVNSMNLTSLSSAGELLSLQPAAVYVQPSSQNGGQVQFYKLDIGSVCSTTSDNNSQSLHKLNLPSNNVRAVELANNLIASMLQRQQQKRDIDGDDTQVDEDGLMVTKETVVVTSGEPGEIISSDYNQSDMSHMNMLTSPSKSAGSSKKRARSLSSGGGVATGDEEVDDIYIDTKDLCSRIAYELKAHSIPQAVFAERVLCRSQGTLSDLLRNPKPWNKLKSGRETFRRMYQWLKQPLCQRLESLEMWKGGVNRQSTDSQDGFADEDLLSSSPEVSPGPAVIVAPLVSPNVVDIGQIQQKIISVGASSSTNDIQTSPRHEPQQRLVKKPRLVFTDIQKRTLQAIFKETQRPSREMQQTIAEHLGLDLSTVQNFFMNARRRSRIDNPLSDSPAPYQQVRSITPPPASSPSPDQHQQQQQHDPHVVNLNNNSTVIITSSMSGPPTTLYAKPPAKSRTTATASSSSAQQQRSKQSPSAVTPRNRQKTAVSTNNGKTTTTTYNVHSGKFGGNATSPYEIGTKIQLKIEPAVDYQTHKSHVKAVLIDATITGAGGGKEMKMVS